jgi:two-component system response regulator FixJ
MSGIDLMHNLQDMEAPLPVIVLASNADVRQAVRALHLGAVDFIEKPFVDRVLLSHVRGALGLTEQPTKSRAGMPGTQ